MSFLITKNNKVCFVEEVSDENFESVIEGATSHICRLNSNKLKFVNKMLERLGFQAWIEKYDFSKKILVDHSTPENVFRWLYPSEISVNELSYSLSGYDFEQGTVSYYRDRRSDQRILKISTTAECPSEYRLGYRDPSIGTFDDFCMRSLIKAKTRRVDLNGSFISINISKLTTVEKKVCISILESIISSPEAFGEYAKYKGDVWNAFLAMITSDNIRTIKTKLTRPIIGYISFENAIKTLLRGFSVGSAREDSIYFEAGDDIDDYIKDLKEISFSGFKCVDNLQSDLEKDAVYSFLEIREHTILLENDRSYSRERFIKEK